MDTIGRKILLGALALAVAALPYSSSVCYAGMLAFLLAWVWEGRWAEKRHLLEQHPLVWLLPAFFLLHLVGLWHTDNLKMGWANLDKKIFLLLVPVALASTRPFNKWEINTLFGTFVVSLLTGTVVCIVHALSGFIGNKPIPGLPGEWVGRGLAGNEAPSLWAYFSHTGLSSGIGLHPTYFALYLALGLLILIYVYRDNADDLLRQERIVLYGIFSFFSLFIVFLSSKLLTAATIVIVLFAATRFINRASRRFSIVVVSVVAAAIVGCAFINPVARIDSLEGVFSAPVAAPQAQDPQSKKHTAMLLLGNQAFREINPVFGAGTGDVMDLMREAGVRKNEATASANYGPPGQFIHTLLALGVVGLATLLTVLLLPVYFAYRRKYFLFSAFVSLFFLACVTEPALEVQQGIVFFALFNSLFLFQQQGLRQAANDELVFA